MTVLRALVTTALALGVLWAIQLINSGTGYSLSNELGLTARAPWGLPKVFTVELVHASYQHLEGNSIALAVLMFLVALRGSRRFVGVTLFILAIGGGLYWLFGPSSVETVGASGLIFGYFGYLLLCGIVERSYVMAFVALVVGALTYLFYNGDLGTVVELLTPNRVTETEHIAWQGHLTGFIAGIFATGLYLDGAPESPAKKDDADTRTKGAPPKRSGPPPTQALPPSKQRTRRPSSGGLDSPGGISDEELDRILKGP